MYNPDKLAEVIKELRNVEHVFRRPAGFTFNPATDTVEVPKRQPGETDEEFYPRFRIFVQDYDRRFRNVSPFGVSCVISTTTRTGVEPFVEIRGFKTYRDILWDIYGVENDLRGDADWELLKPPQGLNYSVENKVKW